MAAPVETQAYHRTPTAAGVSGKPAPTGAPEPALDGGDAVRQDILSREQKLALGLRDVTIWTGGVVAAAAGTIIDAPKPL